MAGATVTIEVEDNGPGVPATDRELIFDRFYRVLGGPSDGSGLGLAIVHEIAEQHGARIEVGDGLPWPAGRGQGFGAAFVVLLARAEPPGPGASGSTAPGPAEPSL
ncbi:MAG: sensor histidine kinase [Burkholderiaceae bacterium]